ncbi:unknown [Clostridium sp. CAG:138]|nr:unknown [Clostridium sp. CAG:138]
MNRNPLPFLFYLYNARTRFLVACFWKFFKKTYAFTNRQFGRYSNVRTRSDSTPGCVTGTSCPAPSIKT